MKDKEVRKVPKLRFPGFTDDWEQRKLGDISEFSKGNSYSKADLVIYGQPIILYGRLYTNYETVIRNVDTYVKEKPNSVLSKGGEVIVPASGETASDISRASVVENSGIILGGDLNIISVNESIIPTFLALTISNGRQQKELSKRAQGKSVVHLRNSDLTKVDLLYPSSNEQNCICKFFKYLDNLITLHQRKLENLKNLKKGLHQKMFPKNGEKVPELRFPGFTDDWEQRKLGELGNVGMCKRIFKEQTFDEGDVPFFKIGTFGGEADAFISRELFEEYKKKYPYPEKGAILISASGTIGRTVEFTGRDEYFQDSNIVWLKHDSRLLDSFLKYVYECIKWNGIEGSTIKRLYNNNILKTEIRLPEINEQKQISTFFKFIDNLITLHQRKLEHLQMQKKGLLQQMFV
nr:restriction endonuclease subunit S [uncultured Peptostreptococcus sp.]